MKYVVIQNNRSALLNIKTLCRALEVSASGFYKWFKVARTRDPIELSLESNVLRVHFESRNIYGVRKVTNQLKNEGIVVDKSKVHKIMKKNNLRAKTVKKFRPSTTDSNHKNKISPRLFQVENAKIEAPNQVWAGDITYVSTGEGWLYLSVFIDLFSRLVVGYAMNDHLKSDLVRESFVMALGARETSSELIVHTDRGVQYTATEFRTLIKNLQLNQSMSRKGNCYDNAYVESFFAQMKKELDQKSFPTKRDAKLAILDFINNWYNNKRIHSALDYISPTDFELKHLALAS
jgi:putative transposase